MGKIKAFLLSQDEINLFIHNSYTNIANKTKEIKDIEKEDEVFPSL